ncbi:MAG: phosphopantetheine-binding protein [Deltaproteobacteria bacterium]
MTEPALNQQIKELIVDALQLEGVDPSSISDSDALFGSGLSLDSIDALELATALARKFEIDVGQDDETRAAFRSVNHLAAYVTAKSAVKPS